MRRRGRGKPRVVFLRNSCRSCVEGLDEFFMSESEIIAPISEEDVDAVNVALSALLIR